MPITYRTATEKDAEKIQQFIQLNFVSDEPLNRACKNIKLTSRQEKTDNFKEIIQSGLSTIAENAEGTIVGVRLSKSMSSLCSPSKHTNNKLLKLFDFIAAKADVFNTFQVNRIAKGYLLCVHQDHRQKGIAAGLYVENMKLAKQLDYPLYVCDCSSKFTALACEKLQMTKVYELLYKDYVSDGDGKPIFQVEAPHDKIIVFAKIL